MPHFNFALTRRTQQNSLSMVLAKSPMRLSPRDLSELDSYKYSGKDYSLASKYFMQRYWSIVVELLPKTIAPNMLTAAGFACSTSTSVLLFVLSLLSNDPYPNWVWAYAAVSLFVYQTLDAIDGKQARRTGCGSPLGELFDHGCDALFTPLMCTTVCLAVGFTPAESFTYCFIVTTGLFLSLYEQFCTGTLDLGYINGPVEGILVACVCFLWSAIVGPQWWATPFASPLIDTGITIGSYQLAITKPNDITMFIGYAGGLVTMATNLLHAFMRPVSHDKIHRNTALLPQLTIAGMVAYIAWAAHGVLNGPFPFALELMYGFLTSYTVTRMTVCRLCRKMYHPFSMPHRVISVVLLVVVLMTQFSATSGRISILLVSNIFAICTVLTLAAYVVMIGGVFVQVARYLKINIITMTPEQRSRNL
jgi:ethanolaminephosphotransferase